MINTTANSSIEITNEIISYVLRDHPSTYTAETMPLDDSLLELGVLDSFGIVELVEFLENNWSITIEDDEITKEKMGSINKMSMLVGAKLT